MSTQITKLEQAVKDWKSGMTAEEAAKKNQISKEQLERAISLALNPMADEEDTVGDSAAFKRIKQDIQGEPVATATLENSNPAKRTTIVVYERNGQKEAFAYDPTGRAIDLDAVYKEYGIESTTIDSDGRLAFKGSKEFEYTQDGMRQPSGEYTFWDKFTNFFKGGKDAVVAGERQYAQAGVPAENQQAVNAAFSDAIKDVPRDVKAEVAALAQDCQAKVKAGDTDGAKEAQSKLAEFLKEHPTLAKSLEVAMQALPDIPEEAVLGFLKGTAMIPIAALGLLTSCAPDINQDQHVELTISQDSSLQEALDALLKGQEVTNALLQKIIEREISNGMTLDDIKDLIGGNTKLLVAILDAMTENNQLLTEVRNSVNGGFENVLSQLVDIKQSIQTLTDLVAEFPQYKTELNEIINGIKTGNTTMTQMKALIEQLLKKAVENGDTQVNILNKLTEIQNSNKSDGEKLAEMLKLLGEIKTTLDGIAGDLKEHFKNDAVVNGYLEKILAEAKKNNAKADETNALLQKLYTLVEKLGKQGDAMGKEILNYIAAVGFEMNRNFSTLIDAVDKGNVKLDDIKALLAQLNTQVKQNGEDGKKLGNEILNYLGAVGFEMNRNFTAVLEAINKGNVKLGDIEKLVAQLNTQVKQNGEDGKKLGNEILNYLGAIGFEMNRNFTAVLEAINNGVAGTDSLRDLLAKVLEKQDKNTKAIINAIGNIKVGSGGTVDLSSLEAMVAELLKQSKANGNILSNIDAKTDVIATTTKSILAALEKEFGKNDTRYKNIMNILNVIANKAGSKGDDTKLLAKLDEILAKLDEIKNAIKDHKVTVNVTGQVECKCNCGNNNKHEGILGDLNDLMN